MTPTPRLRFVEREFSRDGGFTQKDEEIDGIRTGRMIPATRTVRILQQWWEWKHSPPLGDGEWRDVPVEKEAS